MKHHQEALLFMKRWRDDKERTYSQRCYCVFEEASVGYSANDGIGRSRRRISVESRYVFSLLGYLFAVFSHRIILFLNVAENILADGL
jgi:hypothetical protein